MRHCFLLNFFFIVPPEFCRRFVFRRPPITVSHLFFIGVFHGVIWSDIEVDRKRFLRIFLLLKRVTVTLTGAAFRKLRVSSCRLDVLVSVSILHLLYVNGRILVFPWMYGNWDYGSIFFDFLLLWLHKILTLRDIKFHNFIDFFLYLQCCFMIVWINLNTNSIIDCLNGVDASIILFLYNA